MKNINYILLLLIIFSALTCNKHESVPPICSPKEIIEKEIDSVCYNFPVSDDPMITYITYNRFQYHFPNFNPNNANEFVYYYRDLMNNVNKIIKYNIGADLKTELTNLNALTQIKWSRKGWIAFDRTHQIYIIKDNGDSLKQFTSQKANLYPVWDATGDNLYWNHSLQLGYPYYLFKKGLYGSIVDTLAPNANSIFGYTQYNDVSINNTLLTRASETLAYTNIDSFSLKHLMNLEQHNISGVSGISWANNSQTAYFTVVGGLDRGIYKIDINTNNYTRIMEFCDSKYYTRISCSPDGKKLIGERIDSYQLGVGTGYVETVNSSSIYIIDLLTLEEKKIELEQ